MKTSCKILFGIVYTLVYALLAIAMINPEGTGTGIFLVPLLTWGFLFVVLFLSGRLKGLKARIFFILLMATHYFINLLLISNFWNTPYSGGSSIYRGKSKLIVSWENESNTILFLVAWYVFGQIFIWAMFFREARSIRDFSFSASKSALLETNK